MISLKRQRELTTDLLCVSGDMDASDQYEILSGSLVGLVPVLLLIQMNISVYIVSQLQFWHLH
jgi:hypothetical protein